MKFVFEVFFTQKEGTPIFERIGIDQEEAERRIAEYLRTKKDALEAAIVKVIEPLTFDFLVAADLNTVEV